MKSVHEKRSGSSIRFLSGFAASWYLPPLVHSQYRSQVNSPDMQLLSCYSPAYNFQWLPITLHKTDTSYLSLFLPLLLLSPYLYPDCSHRSCLCVGYEKPFPLPCAGVNPTQPFPQSHL